MAVDSPRDPHIDTDDLFGKLDQLISRHQGRAGARPAAVPTLTEAVDALAPAAAPPIPVLSDVVEVPGEAPADTPGETLGEALRAPPDKRRQLQVALYLRLRQRLDQELGGEAFAFVPPAQLSQVAHALRTALPAIIRDSVDQVLGSDPRER
jgi:hypothetical protein